MEWVSGWKEARNHCPVGPTLFPGVRTESITCRSAPVCYMRSHSDPVDFSSTKQSFHYNRTFAIAPSDDQSTENAWNELVPRKPFPTPINRASYQQQMQKAKASSAIPPAIPQSAPSPPCTSSTAWCAPLLQSPQTTIPPP